MSNDLLLQELLEVAVRALDILPQTVFEESEGLARDVRVEEEFERRFESQVLNHESLK